MVMRPGAEDFSTYAFFPLAAAEYHALAGVTFQPFDGAVTSALLSLYSSFPSSPGTALSDYFLEDFKIIGSTKDMFLIFLWGFWVGRWYYYGLSEIE